jgi:hypothetical protein
VNSSREGEMELGSDKHFSMWHIDIDGSRKILRLRVVPFLLRGVLHFQDVSGRITSLYSENPHKCATHCYF